MMLRTPSGAIIDASEEAAPTYLRCGFTPFSSEDAPKPTKKTPAKKRTTTRKAAPSK